MRFCQWELTGFFLIGIVGGGVQLGPLGTAATNRPIVAAPGDYDDVEIGGMIDRGNWSTRSKPAPVTLFPPQTPHAGRTRTRVTAVGSYRLTAWATGRPHQQEKFAMKFLKFTHWFSWAWFVAYFSTSFSTSILVWSLYMLHHNLYAVGRAIAQAVSCRLPTAAARVQTRVWSCRILWWTKVALRQVFSENFGFPCQSTFHLLLHNHLHSHPKLAQ
jgi:hypothetical protein